MFKVGDKVVVNSKAVNKELVGQEFTFGGYLREPQAHGSDYPNIDCILVDENDKLYYSCSDRFDKILSYDISFDGTNILVDGHKTIVKVCHGGNSYMGIAKCSPEDKFDLTTGINLAMARAYDKFLANKAARTKVKPPKGKIAINTVVTIRNAGSGYSHGNAYIIKAIKEGSLEPGFDKFNKDVSNYYGAYGSHPVPNEKFAVRGYTELYGNKVYFIQKLDSNKHELYTFREDGIAVDQ